jgi:hypothetical protein
MKYDFIEKLLKKSLFVPCIQLIPFAFVHCRVDRVLALHHEGLEFEILF